MTEGTIRPTAVLGNELYAYAISRHVAYNQTRSAAEASRHQGQRLKRWLLFLVAVCFSGFAVPVLFSIAYAQAPAVTQYNGTTTVRLYRHSESDIITMKVPNGYVDHFVMSAPRVPGAWEDYSDVKTSMYFNAEASTFRPRSAENNSAFEYPNNSEGSIRFRIMTFHLRSAEDMSQIMRMSFQSMLGAGEAARFCTVVNKEMREGLEWQHADQTSCDPRRVTHAREVFVERDEQGNSISQIVCLPEGAYPGNPTCSHLYYFRELHAQVHIQHRRPISEWRLIRGKVNSLLLSFVQPG